MVRTFAFFKLMMEGVGEMRVQKYRLLPGPSTSGAFPGGPPTSTKAAPIVQLIDHPTHMAAWSAMAREKGHTVGFVPTMGALHEGHLALVQQALKECGAVACSIFVNPLQFNDANDLAKYPRQLDTDLQMLRAVGCHAVFTPLAETLFGGHTPLTYDLGGIDRYWEGPSRPGHFQGVANVVERLFHFVRPERAYFGEKDRQQLTIIRHLARTLSWPEQIVPCPTVRAADGLALSSRNQRLSAEERAAAPALYRALQHAAGMAFRLSPAAVTQEVTALLATEPLVDLDHFGLAHADTLAPLESWPATGEAVALIAAQVGPVRLIDNLTLRG